MAADHLLGGLVIGVFALIRFMPRTRPAEIKPDSAASIGWSEIAGADEAKEELREVVDCLSDPKRFRDLGAKVPKGILLHVPGSTTRRSTSCWSRWTALPPARTWL